MRHASARRLFICIVVIISTSITAFAQGQPTSLSITPSAVYQGQCYIMTVGNGANMILDVQYTFNSGPVETITTWPTLNGNGQANICTTTATAVGTYHFVAIRNTQRPDWFPVNVIVNVVAPSAPQPTSLGFSSSAGYAGNDCYTMSVGNGANMTVDLQYTINGISQPVANIDLNPNGQWSYCLGHFDKQGTYEFRAIKNTLNSEWVSISPVYYTIRPPQPTSFSINPSTITAGNGSMTMTGGNSADVTLDVQYRLNNGPVQTIYSWPYMARVGTTAAGSETIVVSECTPAGDYVYTAVKNHMNTPWVSIYAPVRVIGPAGPTVTSLSQNGALRGTSVNVTIYGTHLCGVTLSTTSAGLTFSNISPDPMLNGTYVTATFNIASTASVGTAPVTVTASGGSTIFAFAIDTNGQPSVTGITPASGATGTNVPVTISGTNLTGASLSTSWKGLTFSNITSDPQGLSLNATFIIASAAATGTPTIQVATSAGSVDTQLFSITPPTTLAKEYIYLGDRIIAIEGP